MSVPDHEPLCAADISLTGLPDWQVEILPETDSTNDDARRRALAGAAHGTVVVAEWQSSGRGRRGAAWVSPARRNLLLSVVLRPPLPPEKWTRLPHACGLAVCDALDGLPGMPAARVKWPNDVHVSGRKLCGILVESVFQAGDAFAIAGMGLNVNLEPADLPDELRDMATSVWLERGGVRTDRAALLSSLLQRLNQRICQACTRWDRMRQEIAERSLLAGRKVSLQTARGELCGLVTGFGPEGELILDSGDGPELISSADLVRLIPE